MKSLIALTAFAVFTSAVAGYIFAKFDFPLKQPLFVLVLATLLAAALPGCVPYATPPATVAIGLAHDRADGARTGLTVDAGLAPLQIFAGQQQRRWDAAVLGSYRNLGRAAWGAAIAVGPVIPVWPSPLLDEPSRWRVVPQVVARVGTLGETLAIRATLERFTFVDGADGTSPPSGYAYGEAAIGGYVEVGYLWGDRSRDGVTATVGVSVRLPITAGIACCIK